MPKFTHHIPDFVSRWRTKKPSSATLSRTEATDDLSVDAASQQTKPTPTQDSHVDVAEVEEIDWTGRVVLTSIFPEQSEQPRITEAQKELQDATESLQAALQKHISRCPFPELSNV
ncbi:hypothetical protein QQX98_003778 [Neonectria punicea]|uniref:Uncharacterized protein n=1 Tax=Neonectria punicea TaxID=979145 RepID=A0ABR1HCU9_9HYPO